MYTQVGKRFKRSTLFTSGLKVRNVNIILQWLQGLVISVIASIPLLEIKDTTNTDRSASYFDQTLEIDSEERRRTKLYDKRYDFNFPIVNFPFICSNIPAAPAYGVYIALNIYDILELVVPIRTSLWPLWNINIANDHGYVPLIVSTSWYFPRSWLITGFVTRLTRRVSLVEQ